MLYLLFQLGNERYALEAAQALEVIPYVALKKIPRAPQGVAGVFNYRGQPVPAVDLCELTLGRPARELLSTRIIVVNYQLPRSSLKSEVQSLKSDFRPETSDSRHSELAPATPPQATGLIVEHATGMIRREPGQFVAVGVELRHAPYLGPVIMDEQGVIQLLHPEHLLTENVRQLLQDSLRQSNV